MSTPAQKHAARAAEAQARKEARQAVKAGHGTNASVKDRLDRIEEALGMVPAAKK